MSIRKLAVIAILLIAVSTLGACSVGEALGGNPTVAPTNTTEPLGPAAPAEASPTPTRATAPTPVPAPVQAITKGMVAPDLTVADLQGVPRSLSDYRGQIVMLNFWASWCGYCRSEIPHMNTVYDELRDQGFEIVAVNMGEDPEHLRQFAAEYQMEFPILADVEGVTVPVYQIRSIPTSYFLDREGVVQVLYGGAIPEETLRTIVKSLLDQ
jgi:thiol-disulfide isomerase/thioredoxin